MKSFLLLSIIFFGLYSCQSNQGSKPMVKDDPSNHTVVVKEVLQVNGYTYLRATEKGEERWFATPPVDASIGETYYYKGGFEMTNFKSKELNRVFESIYFLDDISSQPITANSELTAISPGSNKIKESKKDVNITPVEGGVTIAELFANKAAFAGKKVKIKGSVTKFSPEIMETNWIHLQDGTEFENSYDITVTSKNTVKEGDVVVFEGTVTLDKDLGFGYFFKVLLEDAKVLE